MTAEQMRRNFISFRTGVCLLPSFIAESYHPHSGKGEVSLRLTPALKGKALLFVLFAW